MLKSGGEVIPDWMHAKCNLAWKEGRVLQAWTKADIVPVGMEKGKENVW